MGNLFCRKSSADSENIPAEASKYLATNVGAHDAQQGEVWRVALGAGCYWGKY